MQKLSLITRIRRKLKDRKGQSTTEYILILAIVVMIASNVKKKLGTTLNTQVDNLNGKMGEFYEE